MKYSIYNYTLVHGNKYILYNVASDGILVLLPQVYQILTNSKDSIDDIAKIHPELYKALSEHRMIVHDDENESQAVIERWKEEDNTPYKFSITINPTMDCNLRCWYCYEKHCIASKMNERTILSIQNLIRRKIDEGQIKVLNLSFFGGEPLLYFEETVVPILRYAKDLCESNNIELYIDFTTNGVLLTKKVITELQKYPSIKFQITLDGDETQHNDTRRTIDGQPTYQTIIQHIKDCISIGFDVVVRMNYTQKNATTFINTIKNFRNLSTKQKKRLHFSFHKVWQEQANKQVEDTIKETKEWFEYEHLQVIPPPFERKDRCYADKENNIAINYNGDLYKCTALDFSHKNREGVLNEDGTLSWNEKFHQRMSIKYGHQSCRKCLIYPLCHGGCTQNILFSNIKGCIRKYTHKEKTEILDNRIKYFFQRNEQMISQ